MVEFKIILLLNLLNIFSLQAIVKLPVVERSVNSLQNEFNALMKKKSSPRCLREYFKNIFWYKEWFKSFTLEKSKCRTRNCYWCW